MTMDSGAISFDTPSREHLKAPTNRIILFVLDNESEHTKNITIDFGNIRDRGDPNILRLKRGRSTATVLYETELHEKLNSGIENFNRFIIETIGVSNT